MAAFLDFVDARNTLKISFQSVGVAAYFHQEVPLTALENGFPERVHFALDDKFAFDDDADPIANLLNLLELMR